MKKIIAFILSIMLIVAITIPAAAITAKPAVTPNPAIIKKNVKILMCWAPKVDSSKIILSLSEDYKRVNPKFSYSFEYVPQADVIQKTKVLLSGNSLPDAFTYGSSRLNELKNYDGTTAILDVEETLTKLGVIKSIEKSAISILKSLNNEGKLKAIPLGLNIEGFYYNKALFSKAGITETPKTWDDLMAACSKLVAAGIQPIALGGKDKWPITRLVNAYVYRLLGKDSMKTASTGKASFTDAGYVTAADKIAEMAKLGYFGKGAVTVDNGTAETMVTNGKAAINYDGSWFTDTLNDAAKNPAGTDGIGFFPVPLVTGGDSVVSIYPMNAGTVLAFSAKKYDAGTAAWLTYIIPRFGDKAMATFGSLKGYVVNNMPATLPSYTKLLTNEMAKTTDSTYWFEAFLDSTTNGLDGGWAQSMINGEMTGKQFMQNVQDSVTKNRK